MLYAEAVELYLGGKESQDFSNTNGRPESLMRNPKCCAIILSKWLASVFCFSFFRIAGMVLFN